MDFRKGILDHPSAQGQAYLELRVATGFSGFDDKGGIVIGHAKSANSASRRSEFCWRRLWFESIWTTVVLASDATLAVAPRCPLSSMTTNVGAVRGFYEQLQLSSWRRSRVLSPRPPRLFFEPKSQDFRRSDLISIRAVAIALSPSETSS
jgi:hypothetical protein